MEAVQVQVQVQAPFWVAKNKAYYAKNKQREKDRCKAYYQAHKEEMKARQRQRYNAKKAAQAIN